MDTPQLILFGYAILLVVGGLAGLRAKSKISCIMGSISALFVFIGLYIAAFDPLLGYWIITGLTGCLIVVFVKRLVDTRRFMPSGMLVLLSLGAFITSILQVI